MRILANTIDPNLMLSSYTKNERTSGKDILGKDDFLKILMVQLQNQDPMNPMQDKDFIAQMATFSSLEQMTNMSKSIDQLVQMESQTSLIAFHEFVGKEVTWHQVDENEQGEESVTEGKGRVKTVQFMGDTVKFILEDGTILSPANISEVSRQEGGHSLIEASHLIGRRVSWLDEKQNETSQIVQSVSYKDGATWLMFEDGTKVKSTQLTKIE